MTMIQQRTSLSRALLQDVSTRDNGRTVYGITVPFDVEAKVNDGFGPYTEVFRKGAFAKTIQESGNRIKLCVNHDKLRRFPIGRATLLREENEGLYGEFAVSKTREGDEALTLIRDGVVDAFSVGFVPIKEREARRGVVERTEVKMSEVSVVAFPAYVDALIGGLRHDYAFPVEEYERLVEVLRTHPELLELLSRDAVDSTPSDLPTGTTDAPVLPDSPSTPEEGAATDEPGSSDDQPTPTDEPPLEHSPEQRQDTYQPAQRTPMSPERRQAQLGMVRAFLAQAS